MPRLSTSGRARLVASLLVVTGACSDTPTGQDPVPDVGGAGDAEGDAEGDGDPLPEGPWPVTEPGHYGVGFRSIDVTYIPDSMTEPRSLRAAVWYPSRDQTGEPAKYLDAILRETVFVDADPSVTQPAPVLLFSHGHMAFAEQSYFMAEHFASHGWIVIAPSHKGNTIFDPSPPPPQIFEWRPQDVSRALDAVANLPEDDPLHGATSSDIVVSGHSFGGYTTMALAGASFAVDAIAENCSLVGDSECSYFPGATPRYAAGFADERIKVAIPMAPGNHAVFQEGVANIAIPVMLITGLLDKQTTEEAEGTPFWSTLDGPDDIRVQLLTGGHLTFSDGCALLPGAFSDDGCGPDFLPTEEAHLYINAYAMAFARKHLWGDTENDDLLSGQRPLHPDIQLQRHP
jgi:predicted dienelactone hydrolase